MKIRFSVLIFFITVTTLFTVLSSHIIHSEEEVKETHKAECITDQTIVVDIKKKQTDLAEKEKNLTQKETELQAKEVAIAEQIVKLEELRKQIANEKTVNDKLNEEILAKLITTVEGMSPKASSTFLGTLDKKLAITVMSKMSTQKLSKIMNIMDPKISTELTELLALGKSKEGVKP